MNINQIAPVYLSNESLSQDQIPEEDIFTEDLVKKWFIEICVKLISVHLVGLMVLAYFLFDVSLLFLLCFLIIIDLFSLILYINDYKKENR